LSNPVQVHSLSQNELSTDDRVSHEELSKKKKKKKKNYCSF